MYVIYLQYNLNKKKKKMKNFVFLLINKNQITKAKRYQLHYKLLFLAVSINIVLLGKRARRSTQNTCRSSVRKLVQQSQDWRSFISFKHLHLYPSHSHTPSIGSRKSREKTFLTKRNKNYARIVLHSL